MRKNGISFPACRSIPVFSLLMGLVLVSPNMVWAKSDKAKAKKSSPVATPTPSAARDAKGTVEDEMPAMVPTPVGGVKSFGWYFKNGCNCAQCRAQRKKMLEEQERRNGNFLP